jgi:hypothetical protein
MKKYFLLITLAFLITLGSAQNSFTLEAMDSEGNSLETVLGVYNQSGTIQESSNSLQADISDGNYTVYVEGPPQVYIYNFSVNEDTDFRPRLLDLRLPGGEKYLRGVSRTFAIDQNVEFSKANITFTDPEKDRIARCNSFDQQFSCTDWSVSPLENYQVSQGEELTLTVNQFSGYTAGKNSPLPVIEKIKIFDVQGASDKREGGVLVDSGLNKTFKLEHSGSKLYRFSFNVSNNGSEPWNFSSQDVLEHDGLESAWGVQDVYYKINGSEKNGSTSSDTEVVWDTSEGGELKPGQSLQAEYLVNVTTSADLEQVFNASTGNFSDTDFHDLDVSEYGEINASIDLPENNTIVQNNRGFTLNGTLECLSGTCGEVSATARRNNSTGFKSFTGEVFEVISSNNSCVLGRNEECTVEWEVNATGSEESIHELDFSASSNYSDVGEGETKNSEIEIQDILIIDLDWDVTEFGVLNPGAEQQPAERNPQGYNFTVSEESNKVDNLWIKASSLVSQEDSSYEIPAENLNYTYQDNKTLSQQYSLLDSGLDPGTTKNLQFWLDVPLGIVSGAYSGQISFKANESS